MFHFKKSPHGLNRKKLAVNISFEMINYNKTSHTFEHRVKAQFADCKIRRSTTAQSTIPNGGGPGESARVTCFRGSLFPQTFSGEIKI